MMQSVTHIALLLLSLGFLLIGGTPALAQSTFTVNSPGPIDDENIGDGVCETFLGSCTLRAAIQEANVSFTKDRIEFSIPSSGTTTIVEDQTLEITFPVVIDGTTSPAYSAGGPPAIILDGSSTTGVDDDGLSISTEQGTEVYGLSIVGYADDGIEMTGLPDSRVSNCYIGVLPDGTVQGNGRVGDANGGNGIEIRSDAQIGDFGDAGGPNVIAGNAGDGIYVEDASPLISNNIIGLGPGGDASAGNGRHGVFVDGLDAQVTIQGNTISGNTDTGVYLRQGDHLLTTNVIGLNEVQTAARPNENGIVVASDNNLIGGNELLFANIVAGNTGDGIAVGDGTDSGNGNQIQYNYIGTTEDRDPFGHNVGIRIARGSGNTVDGNVVGFNAGGMFVDENATSTEITRNYVGVSPEGFNIGNTKEGITDSAVPSTSGAGTRIGLASPGTSNYISNNQDGILVTGRFTRVQNNFIGSGGANEDAGILLARGPSNTTIGTAVFGNEIVFNTDGGIVVVSGNDITIQGNYIGVTAAGDLLGNDSDGIRIAPAAGIIVSSVTIGYSVGASIPVDNAPLEGGLGNRIRNNALDGVRIAGAGTVENASVRGNIIASNGGIGVDLGPDGATANDFGDTDTGANKLQNTPEIDQSQTQFNTGTGDVEVRYRVDCNTTDCAYDLTVDFYVADGEAGGEGETYIGTDTYPAGAASSFRNIAFTPPSDVSVSTSDFIVGVATDADGNSSEFTGTPQQLPVELAGFEARAISKTVVLTWKTLSEQGNDRFEIEQKAPSADGFRQIGTVEGAGTTTETTDYRFATEDLAAGTHTFRLRQVDVDGTDALSRTVTAQVALGEALVLSGPSPNPVRTQMTYRVGVQESQTVRVVLYDLLGRAVATLHEGSLPGGEEQTLRATLPTLPSGKYFLRLEGETGQAVQPVTIIR